ncbi:unnamed protein product [Clonostachys byssicola]|uniref:CENP-V/GFA domain-containing protein n=1 Tax=Clonostachys byssicola TaxID=160290 RepID=A0A9N9UI11_9HYPO|nr:unnamed protein product [Clonostachys byssicola]
MEAACQCGAVRFTTPLPSPLALYVCHCDDCRRQASSAFGSSAIFPRFNLPDSELLSCYRRPTSTGQTLYCYFCRNCGTRMLHSVPNKNVISIKAGCIQGLDWTKAIHIWAKNAMVPIPEGSESYTYGPPSSRNSCAAYSSPGSSSEGSYDQPDELMGNGSCHVQDVHESTK